VLRISEEEYATIQEVLAFAPHMDRAIVGYQQADNDRTAALFAAAYPPLSERRDVRECLEKLVDLSEQLWHFVEREWVDPRAIQ
jgi:hypothetical protein